MFNLFKSKMQKSIDVLEKEMPVLSSMRSLKTIFFNQIYFEQNYQKETIGVKFRVAQITPSGLVVSRNMYDYRVACQFLSLSDVADIESAGTILVSGQALKIADLTYDYVYMPSMKETTLMMVDCKLEAIE